MLMTLTMKFLMEKDFNEVKAEKLFSGCPFSLDESAVLVMQYAISHKLTGTDGSGCSYGTSESTVSNGYRILYLHGSTEKLLH